MSGRACENLRLPGVRVVVHFTQCWWFSTANNRRRPLRLGHINIIVGEARSQVIRTIPPPGIQRITLGNFLRLARIPTVFREPDFLSCTFERKRRHWWAYRHRLYLCCIDSGQWQVSTAPSETINALICVWAGNQRTWFVRSECISRSSNSCRS